ncbi:N-acetylglucosaminyl-phosphatidylinositol de-N-acetylase [Aphanomyces cochlioides]|nr:N-acetylglucosaminyl-phosphatidylinositol de-N-acetylase [Aphanomyces cochlioides]
MLAWMWGTPGAIVAVLLAILVSMALVTVKSVDYIHQLTSHSAHGRSDAEKKEFLLVIAHPDDESMFFLPLLLNLQDKANFHLLCLSTGDFDGLGAVRKQELIAVWKYLKMNQFKLTILDDALFRDGMQAIWKPQDVASVVLQYAEDNVIDTIFTFDDYGVSGHPNHISVHHGVKYALEQAQTKKSLRLLHVYTLDSTPLWRKYLGLLDIVFVSLSNSAVVAIAPWVNYQAMALHHSQFVWFRRLFVVFSRYTFINTLTRLDVPPPKEKKVQ